LHQASLTYQLMKFLIPNLRAALLVASCIHLDEAHQGHGVGRRWSQRSLGDPSMGDQQHMAVGTSHELISFDREPLAVPLPTEALPTEGAASSWQGGYNSSISLKGSIDSSHKSSIEELGLPKELASRDRQREERDSARAQGSGSALMQIQVGVDGQVSEDAEDMPNPSMVFAGKFGEAPFGTSSEARPADVLKSTQGGVPDGVNATRGGVQDDVEGIRDGVGNSVTRSPDVVRDGVAGIRDRVRDAVKDEIQSRVQDSVRDVVTGIRKDASGIRDAVTGTPDDVQDGVAGIREGVRDAVNATRQSVQGAEDEIRRGVQDGVREAVTGIGKGASGIRDGVQDYVSGSRERIREGVAGIRNGVGDAVTGIANGATGIYDTIETGAVKTSRTIDDVRAAVMAPRLGLTPEVEIRSALLKALAFLLLCAMLGAILDMFRDESADVLCDGRAGRPTLKLLFVLIATYLVLGIALFSPLFTFSVQFVLGRLHMSVNNNHKDVVSESLMSVLRLLVTDERNTNYLAAAALFLFAVVIPMVKLFLLGLGEYYRGRPDSISVERGRQAIFIVQVISKWACPDMFAYIFMWYLVRTLDSKRNLEARGSLDIGFMYFAIFCVFSTLSSLALVLPKRPSVRALSGGRVELREYALPMTLALSAVFVILLVVGLWTPCMGVRLDLEPITEPNGPIPKDGFKRLLVDLVDVEGQSKVDVSLWACTWSMLRWAMEDGELNSIISFILMGVFVILIPVLDMAALTVATCTRSLYAKAPETERGSLENFCDRAFAITGVLKHVAMLDVCTMGVVVFVLCGQRSRSSSGIVFSLMPGTAFLFAAEVVHHAAQHLATYQKPTAEESLEYDGSAAEKL